MVGAAPTIGGGLFMAGIGGGYRDPSTDSTDPAGSPSPCGGGPGGGPGGPGPGSGGSGGGPGGGGGGGAYGGGSGGGTSVFLAEGMP
ncbi:MAG TPA: hypothetical protein VKT77_08740, partial [Chthonomonadaceae bacterium]|nr:hypothetical protein [Chthonomonadaceae bacterium]